MTLVQVGGNDDLKFIAPHLTGQFHADLMAPFRGDFPRLEALIAVPGDIVVLLAISLFRQNHLLKRRLFQAVDSGDIGAIRCFLWVLDVRKYVEKVLGALGYGFLRVFNVGDQVTEPPLDVPQAGGRHHATPCKNRTSFSSREHSSDASG